MILFFLIFSYPEIKEFALQSICKLSAGLPGYVGLR